MKVTANKPLVFPLKNILSLMPVVLATICTISPVSANAGFFDIFKSNEEVETTTIDASPTETLSLTNESQEQSQAAIEVLRALADSMTRRIAEIEPLIGTKQNTYALNLSKSVLDEVRVKSGIDPKAKLRENFLTPLTFPEGAYSMSSLPQDQQQTIIRTVQAYKGGLYLDIINLTKRVSLLYVKALHAQFKAVGGLTTGDRNKILKDLATASIIPMPMQDKKGKVITVFDEDVANDDHTYMFNREITIYLLSAKDLQISESDFEKYRSDLKSHIIGPAPKIVDSLEGQLLKVEACAETAMLLSDHKYRQYSRKCFDTYKFIKDRDLCINLAVRFISDNDYRNATEECVTHFEY